MGDEAQQLDTDLDQDLDKQTPPPAIEDEVEIFVEPTEEELELEAAPVKRNPVRDMRKRIKEQNRENKDLSSENQQLRDQLAANKPAIPAVADKPEPTLEDCGYDTEKFQREYSIWNGAQLDKKLDDRLNRQHTSEQTSAATAEREASIEGHYQRASELRVGDYEEVEDVAVEALGAKLIQSIQSTVDNSEALIYYLGKNPEKAAQVAVLFEANPGKATFELGKIASRITLRPKGKGAPVPDLAVPGGGGALNASVYNRYKKALDAAYGKGDLSAIKAVRLEAKNAGVDLPFNVT